MCEDVISAFSGSCRLSKRRGIPHFFDLIFCYKVHLIAESGIGKVQLMVWH